MPRSRPMKRWSQGELDECRKQIAFLLDQGWIVPSSAPHAVSVVFARKADGTWRFCQDYRGLNAITQRSVEPLPHVDQLVDETRGARFFTKLDLAMAYMQFRIRDSGRRTSLRRRFAYRAASTSSASALLACMACRRSSCGICIRFLAAPACCLTRRAGPKPPMARPLPGPGLRALAHPCLGASFKCTAMTS